ncbi:MAG: hypothetical protein CMK07_16210 [Ponticaulis sp.]|nr:hypothetical protein [Ponticaulis sp.]
MRRSLALCAALGLSACAVDALNTGKEVKGLEGAAAMQTLYKPDGVSDVTLRPGGKFEVVLRSNPSTGYFWQVISGLDSGVVTQADNTYESDPHPEGMVGVGGEETLTFEAMMPGKTTIDLIYARSGGQPVEGRTIRVSVQN